MNLARTRNWLRLMAIAVAAAVATPSWAGTFEHDFDQALGTELRATRPFAPTVSTPLERQIAALAAGGHGRIGVAAMDLTTGQTLAVLGDQRFPLASTSKVAIAAAFLEGVDQGRWSLDDRFPTMLSSSREGQRLSGRELIELSITRSSNPAADGLLRAVGGPQAVNRWMRRAGISDFSMDRDIFTLVEQDGVVDPARNIEIRDSATPLAMVALLKGLNDGQWLSASSRAVLLGAMARCRTGPQRIPGLMPSGVTVAHKTGSLYNTSSDVGIVTDANGHQIAIAIYVTGGKNDRAYRFAKISTIARAIYDGYRASADTRLAANADYNLKQY